MRTGVTERPVPQALMDSLARPVLLEDPVHLEAQVSLDWAVALEEREPLEQRETLVDRAKLVRPDNRARPVLKETRDRLDRSVPPEAVVRTASLALLVTQVRRARVADLVREETPGPLAPPVQAAHQVLTGTRDLRDLPVQLEQVATLELLDLPVQKEMKGTRGRLACKVGPEQVERRDRLAQPEHLEREETLARRERVVPLVSLDLLVRPDR